MRLSIGRVILAVGIALALSVLLAAPASATTPAQFMDRALFKPHHSPITGAMVINNSTWYGIDVLPQLVILTAETALGDPRLGGELARRYNFGCLRYRALATKWGALANGRVTVAGQYWFTFPNAQTGMMAFGRFLRVGQNGVLKKALSSRPYDWAAFGKAYYGNYPGLQAYVTKLKNLESSLQGKAAKYGVTL
jgi:hypothetical protein